VKQEWGWEKAQAYRRLKGNAGLAQDRNRKSGIPDNDFTPEEKQDVHRERAQKKREEQAKAEGRDPIRTQGRSWDARGNPIEQPQYLY